MRNHGCGAGDAEPVVLMPWPHFAMAHLLSKFNPYSGEGVCEREE